LKVALKYYERAVNNLDKARYGELVGTIRSRIETITETAVSDDLKQFQPSAEANNPTETKTILDYSSAVRYIRDQGGESSVIGQALATCIEVKINRATHNNRQVSARYIYYIARQAIGSTSEDSGATVNGALEALLAKGAIDESKWPYIPGQFSADPPPGVDRAERYRISDIKQIKGIDGIKLALKADGPVVAGIEMHDSAMGQNVGKTGKIPLPGVNDKVVGGHAVAIVGYDDENKLFKFVNSWGASWGDHGFGYLPYDYLNNRNLSDIWTFKLAD
jgi:hypothetical protein